jgi:hypothetical protein
MKTKPNLVQSVVNRPLSEWRSPDRLKAFLGCVRRFQLRGRLVRPWHHRDVSSLTDLTVQISRSGFLKRDSPVTSGHCRSEAAATDDVEGARYISPTSIPLEACPELGTPATPARRRISVVRVLPSALLTASASQRAEFSELNLHGLLPYCVRFAPIRRPVNGNTRFRSVRSTVTGRDLHPLDSVKKFHRLILGSSSSKRFPARLQCRRCQALFEHTTACTRRRAPFRSR